jgi:penicillin-binding protein 2
VIATALVLLIFGGYVFDLASVQLVHGEEYAAMVKSVNTYQTAVDAARGGILDRNGNPLVVNRQGYSLIFDLSYFPGSSRQQRRNEIIYNLIRLMEKEEEKWIDALPVVFDGGGNLVFAEKMDAEITYLKSTEMLGLNHYATAQNCFDALVERYSLQEYTKEDARKIASVLFAMRRKGFSMSVPYVFAEDVKLGTVSRVKENSGLYEGVDVKIVTYREYTDGALAVHLLGNVGAISADEYKSQKELLEEKLNDPNISDQEKQALKANEYKLNDTIGKFGVEQVMESYLRGTSGVKTITEDVDGNITEEYTVQPKTGDTVILTMDRDLQKVTETALEKRILELTAAKGLERAGACAVIDVKTGELLASASYPGYDLNTFTQEYGTLAASPDKPLWNRALQGAYAPGSTMKPAIAIAALESGVIDENTRLFCNGTFEYKDRTFDCLDAHGSLNVVEAIDKSCNIFFYRVADMLGINIMNQYSSMFGLGTKTGIELPEANGALASIAYANSLGTEWLPGDTIQAAIGQSYNAFTPLQLANYCAAIANGGTLYTPHIIKSVKSFDYSETILEKTARISQQSTFSEKSLALVREGMRRVAATGFCQAAFQNCPVKVAAKTGTSQVKKYVDGVRIDENNGFLIAYAPYDDPQIAVAVVIEKVNSGTATANVAADIFDYFFSRTPEMAQSPAINRLLP